MSEFLMVEANGRHITGKDKIFGISKMANDAAAKLGKENVINATVGSLLDDSGKLVVLSSVVDVLRSLTPEEYADYAPIGGVPEFLEKVKDAAFEGSRPAGYLEAIATPGGTGAIRNTVCNYSKIGDAVLTSDWYWSPYQTICDENGRRIETYELFDENNRFNITSFDAKIKELLAKQDSLMILFNTPSHNPTGFTPTSEELDKIVDALKQAAKDPQKKITFFLDIAYIDYSGRTPAESRAFFPKFGNLPENILVVTGYSMSKGYTLYGMRSGAMICITQSRAIADEFKTVSLHSNRGTWSNGTRPAMMALVKVMSDPALLQKVAQEREAAGAMLARRGKAFMDAAHRLGLKTCPYSGGYFLTVPFENAEAVAVALYEDNVFAVDIGKGVRFAISSVSEKNCARLPELTLAAAKRAGQCSC